MIRNRSHRSPAGWPVIERRPGEAGGESQKDVGPRLAFTDRQDRSRTWDNDAMQYMHEIRIIGRNIRRLLVCLFFVALFCQTLKIISLQTFANVTRFPFLFLLLKKIITMFSFLRLEKMEFTFP
jgi:hypothetical protein